MAEAYDWETRGMAEELYVVDGRTYEQVGKATGVSVSQLKRWGQDGSWTESRREYRDALGDIKRKTVLLRRDLLEKALTAKDPQHVYAFAAIEKALKPRGNVQSEAAVSPSVPIAEREFETIEELTDALLEAVQHKASVMLAVPGELHHAGVKDLNDTLTLLSKMKEQYGTKKAERKVVSKETLREIKEQVRL